MKAYELAKKYSLKELEAMHQAIYNDPASLNLNKPSIHVYNKKAEKKINEIGWAITYHLDRLRKQQEQSITGR